VKALRKAGGAKGISVIALASNLTDSEAKRLRRTGFVAALTQPVRHCALYEVLTAVWLYQQRGMRPPGLITRFTIAETCDRCPAPAPRASSKFRILVVEDNAVNQRVASAFLARLGCESELARNGSEAVEKARSSHYDLILMDWQMPVMNGIEATLAIRRLAGRSGQVPIVALTGSVLPEDLEKCRAAGMNDSLHKPLSAEALRGAIDKWAGRFDAAA
jgi:CheY-like chemotaxis protein